MEKPWNQNQWEKALNSHGTEEEQEAYLRLGQYLYPIALKLLSSNYFSENFLRKNSDLSLKELADDFVQQTLLKVYENYQNFQWKSKITTYAASILQHEILQNIRKASVKREISTSFQEPDDDQSPEDPLAFLALKQSISDDNFPEAIVQNEEFINHLNIALNQLSDIQKNALIMIAVQEKPLPSVAKELNISMNALYKNVSRARKNIREYFDSTGLSDHHERKDR